MGDGLLEGVDVELGALLLRPDKAGRRGRRDVLGKRRLHHPDGGEDAAGDGGVADKDMARDPLARVSRTASAMSRRSGAVGGEMSWVMSNMMSPGRERVPRR